MALEENHVKMRLGYPTDLGDPIEATKLAMAAMKNIKEKAASVYNLLLLGCENSDKPRKKDRLGWKCQTLHPNVESPTATQVRNVTKYWDLLPFCLSGTQTYVGVWFRGLFPFD